MQAEDVRADGPLRELVVQAFENITGLASQIDEEYLQRLFKHGSTCWHGGLNLYHFSPESLRTGF